MKNRLRRAVTAAALGAVLWMGTAAARAQDAVSDPFAVKVGAFLPADEDARNVSDDAIFILEAEYTVQNLLESNSVTVVGIGYAEKGGLRIMPITISQLFRDRSGTSPYYYGIGLGDYITQLDAPGASGKTKHLFGGFVVAGMDLRGPLFVEAKYHLVARYDNKNVNGFQLTLGTRF